jgi:hypothetical protein
MEKRSAYVIDPLYIYTWGCIHSTSRYNVLVCKFVIKKIMVQQVVIHSLQVYTGLLYFKHVPAVYVNDLMLYGVVYLFIYWFYTKMFATSTSNVFDINAVR